MKSVGIVLTTYQAEKHLHRCLTPWLKSPLKPRILVIDSSSTDQTVALSKELGVETLIIPQKDFNHGLTRDLGRRHLNTDIIVMITQDAYAVGEHVLEKLIAPLLAGTAAAAYGRQIPHDRANFFETFARAFNYPAESHVRTIQDVHKYGVYTFFCSDSCAAYDNRILDKIGGIPQVLFGEDTVVAAKVLHAGHQIAYVADAVVQHSHSYSLKQEFSRHFDIGLSRGSYRHLLEAGGSDSKRGLAYTKQLFKTLLRSSVWLLPYAVAQTLAKWIGYHIGKRSQRAPIWFKKALSSQKFYWTSTHFQNSAQ